MAYLPLDTWRRIHTGAEGEATAVAIKARKGATLDLAAGDAAAHTTS